MVIEKIKRKLYNLEDRFFEKRLKAEFDGIILSQDLIGTHSSQSHANPYQATWCKTLRELFLEAGKTGRRFENFVDIGSGKGKACFYAQRKYPFRKVLGVEFSAALVEIANKNKSKTNAQNIDFLNVDASEFQLPQATNFIFIFNPFDHVVLEKFLSNNLNHFKQYGSIIAYANDMERMSLTRLGFETIFRNQTRKNSLYKYS